MTLRSIVLIVGLLAPAVGAEPGKAAWPDGPGTLGQQVALMGPWPLPHRADPSNRVSGRAQAIELGRRLFRDPRMSPVGYIACVTCHQPDRAFTDRRARAHGLADLPRNTPALANLRLRDSYGWDGASDSLWLASIRPMLDAREFDGTPASVSRIFVRDPELAACYRAVFGAPPVPNAQQTVVNVGKALAAYQETLVTGRTAFDRFRDALQQGDRPAMAAYPLAARRGLELFVGAAGCQRCHRGPTLSDGLFHAVLDPGTSLWVDTGRLAGLQRLRADPMNLQGRFNDAPAGATSRRPDSDAAPDQSSLRGRFRTPGLRNVGVTAPYMHDGRADTLIEALDHGMPAGRPHALTGADRQDLVAFLETLTDDAGERRPWSNEPLAACP